MLWLFIPLLMLIVTAVGGVYAAFLSARVTPSRALRASTLATPIGISRVMMVGLQFAAACLLLVVVIVMHSQTQALRSSALGTSEGSIVLLGNDLREARISFETYKNAHATLPGVQAVSGIHQRPWRTEPDVVSVSRGPRRDAPTVSVNIHGIDQDFFAALEIPLLAGRALDPGFGSDVNNGASTAIGVPVSIVVDRAFVEAMGLSPNEAIGQLLYDPPIPPADAWRPFRIVGVVENRPLTVQSYGNSGNIYELARRMRIPVLRVSAQNISRTAARDGRGME